MNSGKEDEDMAIDFQETLNILDGPDKETFMNMNDSVKMKYIEHLKLMSEQDSESNTEEEEDEPKVAVMQEKSNDAEDQGDDEDLLFKSYCKYMDQKFNNMVENPVHWLDYLHNEWRSMELVEKRCTNILETIQNNKILEDMEYGKDDLRLEELVGTDLENFILESGETPEEIYECVNEWKEKLKNYAAEVKESKESGRNDTRDDSEEDKESDGSKSK